MVEKKAVSAGNEEAKFDSLSDAITAFITNNSRKEREIKLQCEKIEFELTETRKKKDEL